MSQDKHGCYRVGNLKFYSKIAAIEAQQRTGIHLHWDFNEAVFSSYDWKKEPNELLTNLYKRRAIQLREKYDYIILNYSGGADSQNVLNTFLDNNIKLEEIVTYVNYEATGETHNFLNAEAFEVAIPKGKEYTNKYPWLKHRIVDFKNITLDFFSQSKHRYDWFYKVNMVMTPNTVSKESFAHKVPEWQELIDSGKKVCFLYGSDKPRILHVNGKFSLRFIDFVGNCPDVKSMSGQQLYTDELFYWTPDLPEIIIKQAHIIKRYLSSPNVSSLPFVSAVKSDLAYVEIQGKKWWLNNHGIHTLLYPNWDISTFSVGKPSSCIISPRDKWFFDIENSHIAKSNWKTGYNKLEKMLPTYWMNNPDDLSAGLKACWSKDYFLE